MIRWNDAFKKNYLNTISQKKKKKIATILQNSSHIYYENELWIFNIKNKLWAHFWLKTRQLYQLQMLLLDQWHDEIPDHKFLLNLVPQLEIEHIQKKQERHYHQTSFYKLHYQLSVLQHLQSPEGRSSNFLQSWNLCHKNYKKMQQFSHDK